MIVGRSAERRNRHRRRFGLNSPAIGAAIDAAIDGGGDVGPGPGGSQLPPPVLSQLLRSREPLLTSAQADRRGRDLQAESAGLGIIDRLLVEPGVTEILINGTGQVWVERMGELEAVEHSFTAGGLSLVIERMLSPLGLRLDRLNPIVDARLPDGSRVNVVAGPPAIDGPLVAIRRFAPESLPLSAFGPADLGSLLARLVATRRSVLVVGPTSSGKTTLLNALSRHLPESERIVTIEDTAELQLAGRHVVRLESRRANSEGVGEVSLRRLVTTALRLRPDRLVVGEVRGAEAFDLLLALTSGHSGSLCTCHAADAESGLRRLAMLAALADANVSPDLLRRYVHDAVDVVVTVNRRGRRRTVVAVDEVRPASNSNWQPGGGPPTTALRRLWPPAGDGADAGGES
jgi:pilus assembly protein CpaF